LIDDLGIDSLALSELVVFLLVDLQMTSLESDLGKRDWTMVKVGELFDEYARGQAPPARQQFVIRAPRRR
jgi:acyl carrier protein